MKAVTWPIVFGLRRWVLGRIGQGAHWAAWDELQAPVQRAVDNVLDEVLFTQHRDAYDARRTAPETTH